MNADTIPVGGGREQLSFLVECRSLSGFSGSPVFISSGRTFGSLLLGVDFGHIPLLKPLFNQNGDPLHQEEYRTDANTGIACVIPAWRILNLLNEPELKNRRAKEDERYKGQPSKNVKIENESG